MYSVLNHLKFNCGGNRGSEFCSYNGFATFCRKQKRLLTKNMIVFDTPL